MAKAGHSYGLVGQGQMLGPGTGSPRGDEVASERKTQILGLSRVPSSEWLAECQKTEYLAKHSGIENVIHNKVSMIWTNKQSVPLTVTKWPGPKLRPGLSRLDLEQGTWQKRGLSLELSRLSAGPLCMTVQVAH